MLDVVQSARERENEHGGEACSDLRANGTHSAWLARELLDPRAYPHRPPEVELIETHISLVLLAGERVYKLKKTITLPFLDYGTLELRRFFCEEEVRLNRRLAPQVYLGVVPVVRAADGRLRVGGEGEVVEWAVEMARLGEENQLARMLERGQVDNALMNALASKLARFHSDAATGRGVDEHGSPAAIVSNVEQNFDELRPFVAHPDVDGNGGLVTDGGPPTLSSAQHVLLRMRARSYIAKHRDLLQRRVTEGRIREGHGDLHAGNVCVERGQVVIYDCIEFAPRFRCLDVACDLAFLLMDLDARELSGFSGYLAKRYAELAGDPELFQLLDFYKGYRAVVRGKVTALGAAAASDPSRREDLRRESMRYLQLAAGFELPPALVLLCGLPGSGKSWLAGHLARPLRAALFHSDSRRKRLAGLPVDASARSEYGAGLYSPDARARIYASLLEDAVLALRSGRSVVVDATFSRAEFRAPFLEAAARTGHAVCLAHVVADEELVQARLASSSIRAGSDADLDIYLRERAAFEPPNELPRENVVELRSGAGAPEDAAGLLVDRLIALEGVAGKPEGTPRSQAYAQVVPHEV